MEKETVSQQFWPQLGRSAMGRCPQCGEGKLFRAYLKPVEACSECGEAFGHIRADDGPAWLTLVIVGHIFAAALVIIRPAEPNWVTLSAVVITLLTLILLILPRSKGIFIALIWRTGCVGSEKPGED